MQFVSKTFPIDHFVISLVFIVCAVAIIFVALAQLWQGIQPGVHLSV